MTVDFHSHILPGIDDGSKSVEESLEMLRLEAQQGITHVVATPHFYARYDTPEKFLERRHEAYRRLMQEAEKNDHLPQISVGAEVYFFPGISDSEVLPQLTIDGKRYILIEMPHGPWTERMYRELVDIRYKQDLIPIVAHIDRYIRPFKTYGIPERLAELPVLVQANAEFFLNCFTKSMALRMLRKEQIQLLGSDCHNLTTRAPNLDQAVSVITKRLGEEALLLVQNCAEDVLRGESLFE
jgi:protein-tyrosine phosphatase